MDAIKPWRSAFDRKFKNSNEHNIYTTNLKPSEMEKLVNGLDPLWQELRQQLEAFLGFLEAQSHADEE